MGLPALPKENLTALYLRQDGMADCPNLTFLILEGPVSGSRIGDFPAAQGGGKRCDRMKGSQPALAGERIGLKEKSRTVRRVEVGPWLMASNGSSCSRFDKAMKGLENCLMGLVFPGQGWKGGFLLQIFFLSGGQALASENKPTRLADLVTVEVQLPWAVPPEMGFDLSGLTQGIGKSEVIRFHRMSLGGLPAM